MPYFDNTHAPIDLYEEGALRQHCVVCFLVTSAVFWREGARQMPKKEFHE